jgi:hypothetical protein
VRSVLFNKTGFLLGLVKAAGQFLFFFGHGLLSTHPIAQVSAKG